MGGTRNLIVMVVTSPDVTDIFTRPEGGLPAALGSSAPPMEIVEVAGSEFFSASDIGHHADLVLFSTHHEVFVRDIPIDDAYRQGLEKKVSGLVDAGVSVIAMTGSTIVPDDTTHNYQGVGTTMAERIRRLNLLLIQVSAATGISVVDVDRIVAEKGGGDNVGSAFAYSDLVIAEVRHEFARVVGEIGLGADAESELEPSTGVLEMKMPYINKQMSEGVVLRWHADEGDMVRYGEPILDLEVDKVKLMLRSKSDAFLTSFEPDEAEDARSREFRSRTNIRVAHRVVASDDGYLRRIEAGPGDRVHVGDLLAIVSRSLEDELESQPSGVFRAVVNVLEGESS